MYHCICPLLEQIRGYYVDLLTRSIMIKVQHLNNRLNLDSHTVSYSAISCDQSTVHCYILFPAKPVWMLTIRSARAALVITSCFTNKQIHTRTHARSQSINPRLSPFLSPYFRRGLLTILGFLFISIARHASHTRNSRTHTHTHRDVQTTVHITVL